MLPMNDSQHRHNRFNSYLAGILLGMVLLGSFLILGTGPGVFGAFSRVMAQLTLLVAPAHAAAVPIWNEFGGQPLKHAAVFLFMGTAVGALLSAAFSRRFSVIVERGTSYPVWRRLILVFVGGLVVGFASRIAGGGFFEMGVNASAMLLSGGFVFTLAVFLGGYGFAYFFRRQWHD